MASSTTHVIEIETGIGEPAFIPLTLGQELQPISVGKKGMWRIESPRVLDVHAFVYFDGASLFLQSADEESAASVDGFRVGKAWTELHAPCKIDIGGARLRFRSLVGDAEGAATTAMANAPVQGTPGGGLAGAATLVNPQGGGGGGVPGAMTLLNPHSASPNAGSQRPAPHPGDPLVLPKNDRPFRPGEFAPQQDDDSTRVAPLESTGANRVQLGPSGPLPAAGRPIEDDDVRTRADVPQRLPSGPMQPMQPMQPPGMTGPFPAQGMQPVQSLGAIPVAQMGSYGPGQMPMGSQPQMMAMPPNMGSGGYPQQGYPPQGSGGYPSMGPGMSVGPMGPTVMGQPGMSMGPGQMGMGPGQMSMGPGQMSMGPGMMGPGGMPPRPANPIDEYVARYKELSPPKKILVFLAPLCVLSAFYIFFSDDEAPAPRPRPALDGGVHDGGHAKVGPNVPPPVTPPPVPTTCPAGYEPIPGVTGPGGQVFCQPIPVVVAADAGAQPPPHRDGGGGHRDPPPTPAQKTLERQAVDYVATGEYVKALAIYEQLRAQHPTNPAYPEAVRILKAKTGAPPAP